MSAATSRTTLTPPRMSLRSSGLQDPRHGRASSRPSTSWRPGKSWMAGSSPAMTESEQSIREPTTMKNTPFDLTGKVAIITGSSRGIGRSSAELLAKLGAKVVISSRKVHACEEVAEGIRKAGGEAHVIPCNISRREEVEVLINGAVL